MISARAPATSANLGSGFDTFGLALEDPADVVTVARAPETSIEVSGVGAADLPTDPAENIAGIVAERLDVTAAIGIEKGIRPASGLGSSGASAAGTVVALDRLYDLGLDGDELVAVAAEAEGAIAGAPHADNVAAAIHGGFVVATADGVVSVPAAIEVVVCLPDVAVSTKEARAVLPEQVSLADHVTALGRASTLVVGVTRSDPVLVGRGLADEIVTPRRAALVPGFEEAATAARWAGATGVAMSGAGPAMIATSTPEASDAVADALRTSFEEMGIAADAWQTGIGTGVSILEG